MRRSILAWLLFALAAAVPTSVVLIVAVRAAASEKERARAEQLEERVAGATLLRRGLEVALLRSDETLRHVPTDTSIERAVELLTEGQSPFHDRYVRNALGVVVEPPGDAARRTIVSLLADAKHSRTTPIQPFDGVLSKAPDTPTSAGAASARTPSSELPLLRVVVAPPGGPSPTGSDSYVRGHRGRAHFMACRCERGHERRSGLRRVSRARDRR